MNIFNSKSARFFSLGFFLLACQSSHAEWKQVSGGIFSQLCPTHIGGDREYKGHGPNVTAWAKLFTTGGYKTLLLNLYMHQKETRSDWSEARLNRYYWLYQAPYGKSIKYIWNTRKSSVYYTDHDHFADSFYPQDNLVKYFEIKGDTMGKDIGNCTSDDAYLTAVLEPIWVWIE